MKSLLAAALLLPTIVALAADEKPAAAEPAVQRQVSEDDGVRIEELRVRGQTQTIIVTSKLRGLKGSQYEVVPPSGARDPSQAGNSNGQRVWRLFTY
jgi:hypothetical protein